MLACKKFVRDEDGDQWSIGKTEDASLDNLWEFCKTNVLGEAGDAITAKDRLIYLDRDLWFMLGRLMQNRHHNVFDEHIYYIMNQKTFKTSILNYDEHVRDMFEMTKLIPPPSRKNGE